MEAKQVYELLEIPMPDHSEDQTEPEVITTDAVTSVTNPENQENPAEE